MMDEKVDEVRHEEATGQDKQFVTERKLSVTTNPQLAAILQTDKPNPWGRGYLQLYGVCFLVFFCSTMNGKESNLLATGPLIKSQAMTVP